MRTSLHNLKLTEDYLLGHAVPGDTLLFEAQLIINSDLQRDVDAQRQAYMLVKQHGRRELKNQLEEVHQDLFNTDRHRGFREKVMRWFKS